MPADAIEIDEGEHEGLQLHTSLGPRAVLGDGKVAGVEFASCTSVFDSERRFNPKFDESMKETIAADTVIFAIGQTSEFYFLTPEDGIELTDRGLIKVNRETYQTPRPMSSPAATSSTARASSSTPSPPPRWPRGACTITCAGRRRASS